MQSMNLFGKSVSIQLNCGRCATIEGFHISTTYGGLLEGSPTSELNLEIIEHAKKSPSEYWGSDRATYLTPPTRSQHINSEYLPPYVCTAWLTSPTPIDSNFMGSELVFIWFVHDAYSKPPSELLCDAVKHLNWEAVAKDFDI